MELNFASYFAFTDSESTIEESNAMDSISVVEFDTRVLRESRQMEIDFVNQLDVNCKRPRQWASSFPFIPTKRVDVNGGGAKQLEYRSRLREKELKRSSSYVEWAMLGASPRKIRSLDTSGATSYGWSEVAIERQPDEQVVCHDMIGELSCSLSGMRTEVCHWDKKLQEVFDDNTPLLATTYQSRSCHAGDFVQWMWIESRLKKR